MDKKTLKALNNLLTHIAGEIGIKDHAELYQDFKLVDMWIKFEKKRQQVADNACYCGKPNERAMVVCKEHAKKTIQQRKKFKQLV